MPKYDKRLLEFMELIPMWIEEEIVVEKEGNYLPPEYTLENLENVVDTRGVGLNMLGGHYVRIAEVYYFNDHNIEEFKKHLIKSAKIQLQLFERADDGEPIARSFIAMLSYKELYNALAAGDFETAHLLAERMGGRDEIEKENDHPFDYAMGYISKWFVLNNREQMQVWIDKFEKECMKKGNKNMRGYVKAFQGIFNNDLDMANEGFRNLVEDHEKRCQRNGIFVNTENELLSLWGIGLANLARHRGLQVDAIPPLIPKDLLVGSDRLHGNVLS